MSAAVSRRGFFSALARPLHRQLPAEGPPTGVRSPASAPVPMTAIIQGRYCIALTSFCAACVERCPVPGAIRRDRGLPMIHADACTGCGVCHDVCPAPRKAVLMLPRRPSLSPAAA